MSEKIWTAALVVIGDEILSGRTEDRNVAQVATWLNQQGIRLAGVRVVPDETAAIVEAVNELRSKHDYLFTTGGIGPTHDDITVEAIADAFGVPVIVHPAARKSSRIIIATEPEGSLTRVSGWLECQRAPSFSRTRVRVRPGSRSRMSTSLRECRHRKEHDRGADRKARGRASRRLGDRRCPGARSDVADLLRETEAAHPGVAIGSYPFFKDGRYGANFVIRSVDGELATETGGDLAERLRIAGYEPVEGGLQGSSLAVERERRPSYKPRFVRLVETVTFDPLGLQESAIFAIFLERVAGIEPARSAWEADRLPLHHTRSRNCKK